MRIKKKFTTKILCEIQRELLMISVRKTPEMENLLPLGFYFPLIIHWSGPEFRKALSITDWLIYSVFLIRNARKSVVHSKTVS